MPAHRPSEARRVVALSTAGLLALLLQRFDARDHLFGLRPAAARGAAFAAGDHLAVDEHVELAERAVLAGDGEVESVLDVGGKTCRAWAEASGLAVTDRDLHARGIGHRRPECEPGDRQAQSKTAASAAGSTFSLPRRSWT